MVIIGTIVATFGLKGEVKVKTNSDFVATRFKKNQELFLVSPINESQEKVVIKTAKLNSKNQEIVSFVGYDDINLVSKFIGYQILIEKPTDTLKDGQFYYADLWHCKVYYLETLIGEVIDLFDSGAHVTLRIKRENQKDLLYPFVNNFIESVDIENKKIMIKPLKGMLDLWK